MIVHLIPTPMSLALLKRMCFVILLGACASSSRNSTQTETVNTGNVAAQPLIDSSLQPTSLMDLPQSQDGGFVLAVWRRVQKGVDDVGGLGKEKGQLVGGESFGEEDEGDAIRVGAVLGDGVNCGLRENSCRFQVAGKIVSGCRFPVTGNTDLSSRFRAP